MMSHKLSIALCTTLALAAVPGCKTQSQTPGNAATNEAQTPTAAVAATEKSADSAANVREVIVAQQAPTTWQLDPTPRQMREMTFNIGSGEKAAGVIVSSLPEITYTNNPLSNMNRWRAQVALPPLKDLAEQKMDKVKIGNAEGTLVDLVGPGNRHMVVAMLQRHGVIWYFKLVGHHDTVEAEKKGLSAFLASLEFAERKEPAVESPLAGTAVPGTTMPSGHPALGTGLPEGHTPVAGGTAANPAGRSSLAEYKAPATWKQDPERRPMRELTYNIGEAAKNTVVIVSRLPAESYTVNPLANINRWRDQVGLGLIHNMADQPSQKIVIGGEDASIYDLVGPTGGRQILALLTRGGDIWYFKIIGNDKLIESERLNFEAFLASVKFSPTK